MRKLIPKRIRTFIKKLLQWYVISLKRRMRSHPDKNVLDCHIIYSKHGAYCIPSYAIHMPLAKKIIKYGAWEKETTDFISENCGKGDVIHAGTFTGDMLPQLSKAMHKDAVVWAFEPSYDNHRFCKVTTIINDIRNVRLFHFALGDIETSLLMQTTKDGADMGGTKRIVSKLGGYDTEVVQCIIIDDDIMADVDISIIHLDIEGYELQALKGAIKTIRRCSPILVLEDSQRCSEGQWFKDNILSLGYTFTQKLDGNSLFKIKE